MIGIEENEDAKATIFRLLQREQFAEQMKSLKAEKEIPKGSKILEFSPLIDQKGLIRAKCRIGKSQLHFNAKHPILLHWKRHVELFFRNEHKNNSHEARKPIKMISDNRTNIVGADSEFKEYVAAWNKERIEEHLVQQGIRWKFNPPAAPHFRRVWERLVRSC